MTNEKVRAYILAKLPCKPLDLMPPEPTEHEIREELSAMLVSGELILSNDRVLRASRPAQEGGGK